MGLIRSARGTSKGASGPKCDSCGKRGTTFPFRGMSLCSSCKRCLGVSGRR
jgi:hypothetical protein